MANVLVVDDSKFMRNIIRQALDEGSHTIVAEADNGLDAINLYTEKKPDITTMDITIHGKDGIQTVNEIKKIDPHAKIIIVSALSEITVKNSDKNLEADAFLTKPFQKEDLLKTIDSLL